MRINHTRQTAWRPCIPSFVIGRALWGLVVACLWLAGAGLAQARVDFREQYEKGKLLTKQGMFADAVKALEQAVMLTSRGKKHFGAHVYLAQALWKMGDVSRAREAIAKARAIIKRYGQTWSVTQMRQRLQLVRRIESKLDELFGMIRIIPEADPQTVGRLRVYFLPTEPFSNVFQKRVMRYMDRYLRKKGLVLSGKPIYLPKGNYQISILQPQCLQYALTIGDSVMRQILIGDQPASLALKEKQSCKCPNGQVLKVKGEKRFCECPNGTAWHPTQKRCKVPTTTDNRPWIAKNWPWITAMGVAVVAAGVIVPVVLIESQSRDREVVIQGKLFTKP